MKNILALAAMLLAYPAHAELVIDGTTEASFKESIEKMIESYASPEMKKAFGKALLKKVMETDPLTANLSGFERLAVAPQALQQMHKTLDGVSQSDIEREILSAASKTKPLDNSKSPATDNKECDLDKHISIALEDVNIINEKYSITSAEATISVTNNGPFAISGFAVSYALFTEGRAVPWKADDYYFSQVSGGIEPNETIVDTIYISELYDDRIAQPLSLDLKVVDVRDYEGRFLKDPKVTLMGHPNEPTRLDCYAPN